MDSCPCCSQRLPTGGKLNFKHLGKDIENGFKPVGKYITSKKGFAKDIVKYGIPSATGAILGAVGNLGGPVARVAMGALGSKLGTMASSEIQKETGMGLKGGSRRPTCVGNF